ncbi:hypothetical protein [Lentzea flava]|uniref:hypothetical protein n=1 Tax=Lentzea flava TaxID=103732 RepID=UPI0020A27B98|nr:hypothetical protein [Lentzea flava]
MPPPASFGPITPPPTTGRSNSNGAGGSSSPGEFTPGEFTPGAPDLSTPFKPGQFTGVSVPDPNNWAAGQGAGNAGNSDRNGIGMPGGMPPGMPFAPGAGNGANAAERSDASGLVSGGTGAWEGADIPGLGDPSQKPGEGTAPSQKPNEWAASGPGGVGVPGMGGMPMVPPGAPPFSPAAGNGAGGSERSDASGLIGGETEPWEGVDAPGLGEPSGGTVPQQSAETWAASGPGGVGVPGMGGMPMVPPGAPPFSPAAGNGAGGSERSDASGLIGGETEPWEGVDAPGLGDPSGGTVPGLAAQDWEPSSGDQVATSGVPMMPGVPFAPAAGNGANAPERSDASGLVAGGAEAWEGVEVAGLGDPGGVEAPPATREERVQATGAQPVPSIPVVHPAPSGPGEKRREGAAGAPSGLGAQAPATSGGNLPGAVADVVPLVAEDDRVAVVTPDDGNEDFSAWDAGASAGLPWLLTSSRSEDDRDEEPETPDYTLRETTGWGHTAGRTGVVRPDGASAVAAVDISDFVPRFQPPVTELSSSGLDAPEETEPAEETDESEEEQDERTSADLLKQDEKAWGGDSMPKASPGVIE